MELPFTAEQFHGAFRDYNSALWPVQVGLLLVVYALVVYPGWSHLAGQPYLETPTFGLPCPTTIFTMGLLAGLVRPYPRSIFVVPIPGATP